MSAPTPNAAAPVSAEPAIPPGPATVQLEAHGLEQTTAASAFTMLGGSDNVCMDGVCAVPAQDQYRPQRA